MIDDMEEKKKERGKEKEKKNLQLETYQHHYPTKPTYTFHWLSRDLKKEDSKSQVRLNRKKKKNENGEKRFLNPVKFTDLH